MSGLAPVWAFRSRESSSRADRINSSVGCDAGAQHALMLVPARRRIGRRQQNQVSTMAAVAAATGISSVLMREDLSRAGVPGGC